MPRNQPGRLGTAADRFWRKVRKGGANDCWNWVGTKNGDGYGRFHVFTPDGSKLVGAHRISWEWANGCSPGDLCVLHHCDNPACVRPDHLFLGTQQDNADDRDRKGRRPPPVGEANGRAKLTAADVARLRAEFAAGEPRPALIAKYRVSKSTVNAVIRGITWRAA
jgi:hypothetical protein